eukprot:12785350-Prorocentrum_lima.AAC.1
MWATFGSTLVHLFSAGTATARRRTRSTKETARSCVSAESRQQGSPAASRQQCRNGPSQGPPENK